jgi:hypothetical protein
MAGAVAKAGTAEEAALVRGELGAVDSVGSFAGRTHAPNRLPRLEFSAYIAGLEAIFRDLPSRTR